LTVARALVAALYAQERLDARVGAPVPVSVKPLRRSA